MTTKVKKSSQLTLTDRLSHLSFDEACRVLGLQGEQLIKLGASYEINIAKQVNFDGTVFRVEFPHVGRGEKPIVTIQLSDDARRRLRWRCTACETPCEHAGAVFSLVLEDKTPLGLAEPPPDRVAKSLSEEELIAQALAEREQRAKSEKMKIKTSDSTTPWSDYLVTNAVSGKSYRVALRGQEPGESFCSCPDFRTNTLGTCKHILKVLRSAKKRFASAAFRKSRKPTRLAVHLRYGQEITLHLEAPSSLPADVESIVRPLLDREITDVVDLVRRLERLQQLEYDVIVYPDAEEFVQQRLFQIRIADHVAKIRRDPANHPLRKTLLKAELLPYQLDGIAFAAGVGRAILADDMGLGKTIQGVGVAELLAREAGIRKVLVVCPASLKSQWRNEIRRFCDRDCQLVLGPVKERHAQYANGCFFTICNYEQVLRDVLAIERTEWDLIILDEGQRIKNWAAKTSAVIKSLRSRFALVLSGTPLENRLDELYSVVQFVDGRRLAPAFRFFNRHRMLDENGKVLGYKNLTELRENLRPILLRRTRDSVMQELPARTTEIVRIPPTDEQRAIHATYMQIVAQILAKPFLTEMDLLRLRRAMLMCRMSANSTFLVNKQKPAFSTKLERLKELIEQLLTEDDRKTVLFSEWTTMLDLIEPISKKQGVKFVRLDGSVPVRERQVLVEKFQTDPQCKLFLTTNAGSTGLNLQAANTVINVDLPWNPAVLEQRIGRAHRMGQTRPVQVYVLVTEDTLEDNLLATLSCKKDLALAALDPDSTTDSVEMTSSMDDIRERLEVLLGAKPEAATDESTKLDQREELRRQAQRDRVAEAGGEMLGAAFKLLGELIDPGSAKPAAPELVTNLRSRLGECVDEQPDGKQRLTITLPDRSTLDNLASTLAKLLAAG